jgi:hypothetical protein
MLTGRSPFTINTTTLKQVYKNIENVSYEWPKDVKVTDDAKDLVSKILVKKES